jgi:hypothetical protein
MKRILSGAAGLALLVFTIGFVASAARADTFTQPVGDAGSVTFSTDGGVLAFVSAEAADGWTYTIDRQDDDHLRVTFRDANGAEAEFEAELEDGALDVAGSQETGSTITVGDTTGDTIADDDQDDESDDESDDDSDDESDDNSGPGSGDDEDESDDNSGPGSGDDDDESDDNSGHGSDDDEDEDDDDEFGTTTTTVVTIP